MKTERKQKDIDFAVAVDDAIARQVADGYTSVEELASDACMSITGFRRRFVAIYGQQPQQYLMQRRMTYARRMLDDHPELSIVEVARRCGFDDKSNFNRAFRRAFGMAPSCYERGQNV